MLKLFLREPLRPVVYVNEGDTLYVLSLKDNKSQQIVANSNVAFNIDHYDEDWTKLQSIQMQGRAHVVEDDAEEQKALGMLIKKFKQYASMPLMGQNDMVKSTLM
ncbi:MAG: pyridoxamine 5'-phosphate oxidase family protein [Desulfatitalea sp.]|nr:pyridoxamine 5'-phosphate oxidase family protein [Desulfatitalea sp.]